jgi:predicted Zn-dependent protease
VSVDLFKLMSDLKPLFDEVIIIHLNRVEAGFEKEEYNYYLALNGSVSVNTLSKPLDKENAIRLRNAMSKISPFPLYVQIPRPFPRIKLLSNRGNYKNKGGKGDIKIIERRELITSTGFFKKEEKEVLVKPIDEHYVCEGSEEEVKSYSIVDPGDVKLNSITFSPIPFSDIASIILHSFLAGSIMTRNFLWGKAIGEQVSEFPLEVYDSPNEGCYPHYFDDEGIDTFEKAVIKMGKINMFLHNTKTAFKYLTRTTANAGWLLPRAWRAKVGGKESDLSQLINDSLYVKRAEIKPLDNGFNLIEVNVSESYIPDKGLKLKPFSFVVSTQDILKGISGISRNYFEVISNVGYIPVKTPYVRVEVSFEKRDFFIKKFNLV